MAEKKYKLKFAGPKKLHREDAFTTKNYYRLVALRDIPEHGVKSGDFGGLITSKVKLSQEGSCWVSDDAMVTGNVTITDGVLISGKATVEASGGNASILIKGNVRIAEQATVRQSALTFWNEKESLTIADNAQIFGNVLLINNRVISGNTKIYGSAQIMHGSSLKDNAEVFGNAYIHENSEISGYSKISQNANIGASKIHDTHISGMNHILNQTINNGNNPSLGIKPAKASIMQKKDKINVFEAGGSKKGRGKGLFSFIDNAVTGKDTSEAESLAEKTMESYNSIIQEIASYETDIVKIIQYPVMVDRTDWYTRSMIIASNKAKRYMDNPAGKHFKDAVMELESAFLSAESNALKIASSKLSNEQKKRLGKAKDLFSLAENNAATAQEKKVAFQQGLKQLEGVILLPEIAVEAFKVKSGLKEIEA